MTNKNLNYISLNYIIIKSKNSEDVEDSLFLGCQFSAEVSMC